MRGGTLRDVTPKGEAGLTLAPDQHYRLQVGGVDIMFWGLRPAGAGT